jgi:glycosyltransferase involved in cell wall biosynthesis
MFEHSRLDGSDLNMSPAEPCPKVSVHIVTYNHENFIQKALDSALEQITHFQYEIVIGEDCSTDQTRQIIKTYATCYPSKIRALLPQQNLGRGGENNYLATLAVCRGQYIAFLEGDDYWTEPQKLQIQADYLDAHPDVIGCFHDAMIVDSEGNPLNQQWQRNYNCPNAGQATRFNQTGCLHSLRSTYPKCTLMIRQSAIESLPDWFIQSPNDFAMDVLITEYGDLAYLPINVGAYRIHAGGIWQGQSEFKQTLELFFRLKLLYDVPELRAKHNEILRFLIDAHLERINTLLDMNPRPVAKVVSRLLRATNHRLRLHQLILNYMRHKLLPNRFLGYHFKPTW